LVRQREAWAREQALAFELERSELARQALDARMRLLSAQVQPHFLFNTLANVHALVETGSGRAAEVLAQLIEYLRAAVPHLDESQSRLGQEVELVRAYLGLMQMRMPDRLSFELQVEPGCERLRCPAMSVLTLVENAVRHGIDPSEEGGRIEIKVWREGRRCRMRVLDSGVGLRAGSGGLGTGLAGLPSTAISAAPPPPCVTTPRSARRPLTSAAGAAGAGPATPRARATSRVSTATPPGAGPPANGAPTNDPPPPRRSAQKATLPAASAQTSSVARPTFRRGDRRGCIMRTIIIEPMSASLSLAGRLRRAAGFTLIELMVVLVIIGVLAALIVPNVLDRTDDARATAARTDVHNLMQALKLYKLDNQRFPTAEQGLLALVQRPATAPAPTNWKPYLEKLPNDPWGRPYQYLNPGIQGEVDVMSFGADGASGGEGKNADIGSWQ